MSNPTLTVCRPDIIQVASELAALKIGRRTDMNGYVCITEGRGRNSDKYGWCGDFVTYSFMKSGVTDGAILNRAELNNGKWTIGDNLNRLQRWAQANDAFHSLDSVLEGKYAPQAGDIIMYVRASGDHVEIVGELISQGVYNCFSGNLFYPDTGPRTASVARPLQGGRYQVRNFIDVTTMPINTIAPTFNTEEAVQPDSVAATDGGDGEVALP